ncbi:methionyl-tRNA formyltransferase [uncultured Microbacterium sp.]|uniref:methionyl-tRNA formyltransferase n=1 Tax=uncultured Microbacterium sp. TaxID=191216 RepID=UPI0035CBF6D9
MRAVVISQYVTSLRGILRACNAEGIEPVAVICARGRGKGVVEPALSQQARSIVAGTTKGIPVLVLDSPTQLPDALRMTRADLAICRGFPWLLDASSAHIFAHGVVNLHPSFLPELRGPFPVDWAVRRGAHQIGVTAHLMDERFDGGPILEVGSAQVGDSEFGSEIWARIDEAVKGTLARALRKVRDGQQGRPQDESRATYAGEFEAAYAEVDETASVRSVHAQVRAWSLGTQRISGPAALVEGNQLRILRSSLRPVDGKQLQLRDGTLWISEWQLM